MPVQYKGIIDEHRAVRQACGVFDISHMGQVLISGDLAAAWLDKMLTGRLSAMAEGTALYTFLLNDRGGVIDDLIAYRLGEGEYLLIVNASMIDDDVAWLEKHLDAAVTLTDQSAAHAAIAVQGKTAAEVAEKMLAGTGQAMPGHNAVARFEHGAGTVYLCGTGYTGEAGFELVCPVADGAAWLNAAIEAGAEPCGLGARDSLRLEMGYPLNGSDLSPDRTPLEAGLGFFVDLNKADFIGRDVLLAQKADGLPAKLVGIEMVDKGPPPRPHYGVFNDGEQVGELCSGGLSPSLGKGIGMAYLPLHLSKIDTPLELDIRGRRFAARVCKKPFYRPSK
jgi:aminomethyltransferase